MFDCLPNRFGQRRDPHLQRVRVVTRRLLVAGLVAVPLLTAPLIAVAASLSIDPISFTILPTQGAQVLRVGNTGDQPVRVQISPVRWFFKGDSEHEEAADGLILNPPIFTVLPQKTQFIRFGERQHEAGDTEQAYRLVIEEVPDPEEVRQPGLRTVLRFSVPVFIAPAKPVHHLSWQTRLDGGTLHVSAFNDGNVHQRLVRLSAMEADGSAMPIFSAAVYLLPGERHEWQVPIEASTNLSLNLVLTNEQGVEERFLVPAPALR
jgi:fimbrial chaperone protein